MRGIGDSPPETGLLCNCHPLSASGRADHTGGPLIQTLNSSAHLATLVSFPAEWALGWEVFIIRRLLGILAVGKNREGINRKLWDNSILRSKNMEIIFVKAVKNQRIELILRIKNI